MSAEVALEVGRLFKPLSDLAANSGSSKMRFENLVGLRGYWPMGIINTIGEVRDIIFGVEMTQAGSPKVSQDQALGVSCMIFDGLTDNQNSGNSLYDILGTETDILAADRGLTLGGWFKTDALDGQQNLVSKWDAAGSARAYRVWIHADGTVRMSISAAGTSGETVQSGNVITTNKWYFMVGRFRPGVAIDIFVSDGGPWSDTTTITALHDPAINLHIGSSSVPGNYLDGNASNVFICAAAVADVAIENLYKATKNMY